MPRDAKGNPFGIDTIVQTPAGKMHVCGFSVNNALLTRDQIRDMAKLSCGTCAHEPNVWYWHEVEVVDTAANPWAKHAEHTDMCWADLAQREGTQLPIGDPTAIREALADYSKAAGMACKFVWGGNVEE